MAEQSDGSIVISTELDSKGFDSGSKELLSAIKSLTQEIKSIGDSIKAAFGELSRPIAPEVDTSQAESSVSALQERIKQLEAEMTTVRKTELASGASAPQLSVGTPYDGAERVSALQKQVLSVANSVNSLEPTFRKAMDGSKSAISSCEYKTQTLSDKVAELKSKLDAFGQTRFPTQEYENVLAELQRIRTENAKLDERKNRFLAGGGSYDSSTFKRMEYDSEQLELALDRAIAKRNELEQSGGAYVMGADTSQYAQMEGTLSAANSRLVEMQTGLSQSEGSMGRLASAAGCVASGIGNAARVIGSKLLSGIKSAISGIAKMVSHSKSMKSQFSGLTSFAKKFAMSMLGARSVFMLLRKAVNAYMQQNQELQSKLSSCWTSIGNLLGPIITKLINLVASAVSYITAFLKMFGMFSGNATKAMNKAGGSASKSAKELKNQLASFDELNILSDSSGNSGGGGGSDTVSPLADAQLPDWSKTVAEQINAGDWSGAANTLATGLNGMIDQVDWAGIGTRIGSKFNGALSFLATFLGAFDWANLAANLATLLNSAVGSFDWATAGQALGNGIHGILTFLVTFIATFDWVALGTNLSTGFNNMIESVDWGNLGLTLAGGFQAVLLTATSFLLNLDWASLATSFSDFAKNFFDGIAGAIESVDWQQLGRNVVVFLKNIDWAGCYDAFYEGLGAILGGLAGFLWGLIQEAWDSVIEWWNKVAYEDGEFTIEGLLNGILQAIADIKTWIHDHIFKPFINGFKAAFGIASPSTVMAEQGNFIVEGLLNGIKAVWNNIISFFTEKLDGIKSTISGAWNTIKDGASTAWENITSTLSNKWDSIKSSASEKWDAMKSKMGDTWNTVKSTASGAWDGIKGVLSTRWDNLKSNVTTVWSTMSTTISDTWGSIKSATSTTWDSVKKDLSGKWDNIRKSVSEKWNAMKSEISDTWEKVKSTTSSVWDGIKRNLSDKWGEIKSKASTEFENIKGVIKEKGWSGVGEYIAEGIGQGIDSKWKWLKDKVGEVSKGLLDKARSVLKIESPSKLFRDEVGKYIGLGIGVGIEDSTPSVLDSVTNLADAVAEEMNAGEYSLGDIVPTTEIDGALTAFTDKISNSFTDMLARLQAIADSVSFKAPVIASGVLPYKVAAVVASGGNSDVGTAIEASNDELASVVTQLVVNATNAIVSAIQTYSRTTVNVDKGLIADSVINEINRRTRMSGRSPLLG